MSFIARLIEIWKQHHILILFSNPCGQNLCIEISVLSFWGWTYVYIVWLKGTFCLLYWQRKQPLKKAKHKGGSFCVKLLLYVCRGDPHISWFLDQEPFYESPVHVVLVSLLVDQLSGLFLPFFGRPKKHLFSLREFLVSLWFFFG